MTAVAPLQLLVFRCLDDADTLPYEEAIVRALQGGKEAGGYLANGGDLGIALREFTTTPQLAAAAELDGFGHSLTIVLIDSGLVKIADETFWDWLAACWEHTRASNKRHAVLPIALDERVGHAFTAKRPALSALQMLAVTELGERAIRPAMLAMRILHECRVLLARARTPPAGSAAGFLRLFISHAKADALPLALALKSAIGSMPWLSKFYDVDDLPPGSDWKAELEAGIGSSLIIMLRTEMYDDRYWCQQEVLWADEYAIPAVLVDARTGLNHPAATLPFDRVPTVRIPDGNLTRILFLALREGLRYLHFIQLVENMKENGDLPSPFELRVFPFQPSMAALLRACRSLMLSKEIAETPGLIIYPDPTMRTGNYEAAQALVNAYAPGTRLVTPNTLAATRGTTV